MSAESQKLTKKELRAADCAALGKRLARLRIEAGYSTQIDLAAMIPGVDRNKISNWELGYNAPDIFLVPSICRALNCTYAQFFGESIFYSEHDLELISKISTMTTEERASCLNYIDYVIHQRSNDPTTKK